MASLGPVTAQRRTKKPNSSSTRRAASRQRRSIARSSARCPTSHSFRRLERYAEEAAGGGAALTLRQRLVQLQFPIAEGVSADAAYLAATRRGAGVGEQAGPGVTFVVRTHCGSSSTPRSPAACR